MLDFQKEKLEIYTDGGSRANPGESACAFVVFKDKTLIFEKGFYLGIKTNNEAEYLGVLESLKWLKKQLHSSIASVYYYLDSKLVVEQLSGHWKIKDPKMRDLNQECQKILSTLNFSINFHHIPREENALADELVNLTLDQQEK